MRHFETLSLAAILLIQFPSDVTGQCVNDDTYLDEWGNTCEEWQLHCMLNHSITDCQAVGIALADHWGDPPILEGLYSVADGIVTGPGEVLCEVGGYFDNSTGWLYDKAHLDNIRGNCPAACAAFVTDETKHLAVENRTYHCGDISTFQDTNGDGCNEWIWGFKCQLLEAITSCENMPLPQSDNISAQSNVSCEVGGYLDNPPGFQVDELVYHPVNGTRFNGHEYYYSRAHMDEIRANCPISCRNGQPNPNLTLIPIPPNVSNATNETVAVVVVEEESAASYNCPMWLMGTLALLIITPHLF